MAARRAPRSGRKVPQGNAPRGDSASYVATFSMEFGEGPAARRVLKAVEAALSPEVSGGRERGIGVPGDKAAMRRTRGGRTLEVEVRSSSLPSLRASLNAHIRMAALAEAAAAAAIAEEE